MGEILVTGKLLRWGNSYGIRISKADFERLGVTPGTEVSVTAAGQPGRIDLSHIEFLHLGEDLSVNHDRYLAETDELEFPRPKTRRARTEK